MKKMIFPNEETFQRIYSECLENAPAASEATQQGYRDMRDATEEYLLAVQEDTFRYAYQCGYEAAIKQITEHFLKGDVAV